MIRKAWNYVDIWSNTQLALRGYYHWNIIATGSSVRHSSGHYLASVRPNQNWGSIQIGIQAYNGCGCTAWKWRTFRANGLSGSDPSGSIFLE